MHYRSLLFQASADASWTLLPSGLCLGSLVRIPLSVTNRTRKPVGWQLERNGVPPPFGVGVLCGLRAVITPPLVGYTGAENYRRFSNRVFCAQFARINSPNSRALHGSGEAHHSCAEFALWYRKLSPIFKSRFLCSVCALKLAELSCPARERRGASFLRRICARNSCAKFVP